MELEAIISAMETENSTDLLKCVDTSAKFVWEHIMEKLERNYFPFVLF